MGLSRICATGAMLLMLCGCGRHVAATIDTENDLPTHSTLSGSIAVYPLDPNKIFDVQYKILSADFEADLTKDAFKVDAPFDPSSRYVALIDYAQEIGTDQPWDSYTTTIVYDTQTKQKVFQEDIESDGPSNDVVVVAGALLKQTALDMQNGNSGERNANVSVSQ